MPILVLRASGRLETVSTGGLVLGIGFAEPEHVRQLELPIATGDTVLLFTDGVSELRDPRGRELGVAALARCFENAALGDSAAAVLGQLQAELAAHQQGAPLHDDLTMVVARIGEVQGPAASRALRH
jgi:serine phosphatase RsbU (regulator of sigma subunit)